MYRIDVNSSNEEVRFTYKYLIPNSSMQIMHNYCISFEEAAVDI